MSVEAAPTKCPKLSVPVDCSPSKNIFFLFFLGRFKPGLLLPMRRSGLHQGMVCITLFESVKHLFVTAWQM
jgi:hypothetical protein